MTSAARLVHDLAERARFITARPVKRTVVEGDSPVEVTESQLEQLLRRAVHLAQIADRCGRAVSDGFPATTPGNGSPGGGKGGGKTMPIPTPTGDIDHVPTSSTEAAALTNVVADPLSTITVRAIAHLRRAVHELEQLDATLGQADRMRMLSKVADPPQCYVAGTVLGLPWDETWQPWRSTDFAKYIDDPRFAEPRKVCQWVYWFVRDHGRLPTRDEALKHLRQRAHDRAAGKAR